MSEDVIVAIAGLWKIALVGFLLVFVLIFRGQLRQLLEELLNFTFKKGDTEITWSKRAPQVEKDTTEKMENQSLPEKLALGEAEIQAEAEIDPTTKLFQRYFKALKDKNTKQLDSILAEMQLGEQDPLAKLNIEARHYFFLYSHAGDESALRKLQSLAKREEATVNTKHWLASAYEMAGDHDRAAATYEEAAKNCDDEEGRAHSVTLMAASLISTGRKEEAFARIMAELGKTAGSKEVESHLYEGLANLYEKAGEPELRAVALEKALEGRPNNKSLRFSTAYGYSQQSITRLAFLHYQKQLGFHPTDESALNNIGVECDRLKMPIRSVRYYKLAAGHNKTLAMANLAYRFLNAGFVAEATQILDSARKMEDVHPNVGSAMAEIARMEEAEKKIEEQCIEEAQKEQRFFVAFGTAFFRAPSKKLGIANFSGQWRLPDGTVAEIKQTNGQIVGNWETGSLKYELAGNAVNRGFKATLTQIGPFVFNKTEFKVFGYIEDSPNEMYILKYGSTDEDYSVMVYTKIEEAPSTESTNGQSGLPDAK